LREMEPEEREDVAELLTYRENTAAGRMTTDYVAVSESGTAQIAIEAMRNYDGPKESMNTVFMTDDSGRLCGAVPLNNLITARPGTPLVELKQDPLVWCDFQTGDSEVAELFDKYNLLVLPVIDDEVRIAGVITADDVISYLRK